MMTNFCCRVDIFWKSYEDFLPEEKHIQSKAESWTVEG